MFTKRRVALELIDIFVENFKASAPIWKYDLIDGKKYIHLIEVQNRWSWNSTMRIDLHNHTYPCNHAHGEMEEYILKAMDLGIDVFGFIEHAPMKNFRWVSSSFREARFLSKYSS